MASKAQGENRALLHMVAKLHYQGDLSQVQIAKQLGLSTATISRLLRRARAEGVVRIEVREMTTATDMSARLAEALGIAEAVAVETPAPHMAAALATPLARMLSEARLGAGSVLMLGWGRTVWAVIKAGLPPLPGVSVVPSTGGMQQHHHRFQSNEIARAAADAVGGLPHFVHAPYLPTPEAREAFLADPSVRDAVALWERIDVALLGIGQPPGLDRPGLGGDAAPVGAAGDVVRHYFDIDGQVLDWRGEGRMIGASCAQIRSAPRVIGMALGEGKVSSIIGAARSGLIKALITDTRTAEAVLDRLDQEG